MTTLTIAHLASGGVITNYHCPSRCGHCLYNCSPQREKNYLSADFAATIFERLIVMSGGSVHIGGGEPLLDPRRLGIVLEAARQIGVGIDYVETNSSWYTDAQQASVVLDDLLNAGVHTLLVSMSPFHNAHIPFARVKGVIEACRRGGMNVFPWVDAFAYDLSRLDAGRAHAMDEFEAAFGPDYLHGIPDRYWIHLGGRALNTFRQVLPQKTVEAVLDESPSSCVQALSDTSHFHIDLFGNYIPGLCTGLAISMDDLGAPLPVGKYPLIDRLAGAGIRGLFGHAGRTHGYRPRRHTYLNRCDLCTEIRQFIAQQAGSSYPELAPQGFYDELPAVV